MYSGRLLRPDLPSNRPLSRIGFDAQVTQIPGESRPPVIGLDCAPPRAAAVIGLGLHASQPPGAAGDLNHPFWSAPGGSGNMFALRLGQRPMPRSPPAVGRDIQEGALVPKVNDTL